jgi:hypothetical protein
LIMNPPSMGISRPSRLRGTTSIRITLDGNAFLGSKGGLAWPLLSKRVAACEKR